jgi:hypothetical protein
MWMLAGGGIWGCSILVFVLGVVFVMWFIQLLMPLILVLIA